MPNYADPETWQTFLTEHQLDSTAKPPPHDFLDGVPPQDVEGFLRSWAHVKDYEKRIPEYRANAAHILSLIDTYGYV
jgi:hypothetical protein